jgi:hypothetical protein
MVSSGSSFRSKLILGRAMLAVNFCWRSEVSSAAEQMPWSQWSHYALEPAARCSDSCLRKLPPDVLRLLLQNNANAVDLFRAKGRASPGLPDVQTVSAYIGASRKLRL